jgi:2,3-dihydroxybenzoate-AMP ligase
MEGVRPYPEELFEKYRKVWLRITIIDAFDRTCDIIPDKVAVVEGETRLSFAQLRGKVQKAGLALLELGLGKGSLVLLQIPNCPEAVYVYLALDMIGAVPVLCLVGENRISANGEKGQGKMPFPSKSNRRQG